MKPTQRGTSDIGILLGRLALAALFIQAGLDKLIGWPGIVHLLVHLRAPYPLVGGVIAIACELAGGVMLVLGLRARVGAIVLILFTIGANWLTHRFWLMHGMAAHNAEIQFFLDLAICGGLLMVASVGPGRFAVDRR